VCFYINARNLVNKFEQFGAWVYAPNPDIIGVTESWAWFQVGLLDSELSLQGYDIFRQDREVDRAGSGVLLYVRSTLNAVKFIPKTHYPEHVWCCLLDSRQNQVHVGVCYRTPTVNIYGTGNHDLLRDMINEVGRSKKHFHFNGRFQLQIYALASTVGSPESFKRSC